MSNTQINWLSVLPMIASSMASCVDLSIWTAQGSHICLEAHTQKRDTRCFTGRALGMIYQIHSWFQKEMDRVSNISMYSSNQGTWLNWDCILGTAQVIKKQIYQATGQSFGALKF